MRYPSRDAKAVAERHAEVERLTRLGLTIGDICREVGLSQTAVVRIRRERGLAHPIRRPLSASDQIRAQRMLDDGASVAEVARTLGCGRSQIDDRFPGRAWSLDQTLDHLRALRQYEGNHSSDQIDIMWAAKKAGSPDAA